MTGLRDVLLGRPKSLSVCVGRVALGILVGAVIGGVTGGRGGAVFSALFVGITTGVLTLWEWKRPPRPSPWSEHAPPPAKRD